MAKGISMNRNQLKYLVIAAMLIDHIAWAFVPMDSVLGQLMHFIGRLTGPTMAFFIAEGYCHTKNVKKYALRLGIFALISWLPFVYFEFGTVKPYPSFGVIYTLFLGLLTVWFWDKANCPKWCKVLAVIGICILSLFGDWPIFDILYCLFFFCYRERPKDKWTAFCITTAFCCLDIFFATPWWASLCQVGIFMVPLLIQFCYNGEGGSKKPVHKWFFYVFYPAHLLMLGILRWVVFA